MFWVVIFSLKGYWTVQLIIAPDHELIISSLFRIVKHPTSFLNIFPEPIAIAVICQAWMTLAVGFPLYLLLLSIQIIRENRIMKRTFPEY